MSDTICTEGLSEFEVKYLQKFADTLRIIKTIEPQTDEVLSLCAVEYSQGVEALYIGRSFNKQTYGNPVIRQNIKHVDGVKDLYLTYKELLTVANKYVSTINSITQDSFPEHHPMMGSQSDMERYILDVLKSIEGYKEKLEGLAKPLPAKVSNLINNELDRVLGVVRE